MLKNLSDTELVETIHKKQSYKHFEEFVGRYEKMVYTVALIICNKSEQESLELATKMFVDLWNKINSGSFGQPIDKWVKHTTMMYGINYKHRRDAE